MTVRAAVSNNPQAPNVCPNVRYGTLKDLLSVAVVPFFGTTTTLREDFRPRRPKIWDDDDALGKFQAPGFLHPPRQRPVAKQRGGPGAVPR